MTKEGCRMLRSAACIDRSPTISHKKIVNSPYPDIPLPNHFKDAP